MIRLSDAAAVMEALREHLHEHDISVTLDEGIATARLPVGEAKMRVAPPDLALEARAPNQAELENITGFLAAHVLEFAHPEKPAIRWSGFEDRQAFSDFRELRVLGVADIGAHMRRITLVGEELGRFATLDNLHVRLFFPPEGQPPVWPTRGADGLSQPVDPARRPVVRKYTIRSIEPDAGKVDIDFLLHDDAGPGSDWAKRARPGDLIGMAGPGGRGARPADWLLLAGDETALPAIARILESLPAQTGGHALIEVEDETDELPLVKPDGVAIRWLHRGRGAERLDEAVRRIGVPNDRSHFCWAGAEFDAIQKIRQYWRDDCGVAKTDHLAVAYWRRGVPEN